MDAANILLTALGEAQLKCNQLNQHATKLQHEIEAYKKTIEELQKHELSHADKLALAKEFRA